MDIFERLERLEQACAGEADDLVAQVLKLEAEVDALLRSSGAQNLDWQGLAQVLDFSDATASATPYATKRQIVDARATEVLQQTGRGVLGTRVPEIETFDLEARGKIEQLVHEFDETTIRSIHAARIYLERLHSC